MYFHDGAVIAQGYLPTGISLIFLSLDALSTETVLDSEFYLMLH